MGALQLSSVGGTYHSLEGGPRIERVRADLCSKLGPVIVDIWDGLLADFCLCLRAFPRKEYAYIP